MTAVNGNQSADEEPVLMRPTRTGRAKAAQSYVCIAYLPFRSINYNLRPLGISMFQNIRAAKIIHIENWLWYLQKEPALNTKMRRDDTMSAVNVKQERTSIEKTKVPTPQDAEAMRPVRIKKEKIDEPAAAADSTETKSTKKTSNDNAVNITIEIRRHPLVSTK